MALRFGLPLAPYSCHARSMPRTIALELAVQDPEGVAIAARAGADRIELCAALALGGITPSHALIALAVAAPVPAPVLIRPRAGNFEYSDEECALIVADVAHCAALGAAGVVIGGTRAGVVDTALVEAIVAAAGELEVTFHRAIDVVPDRLVALDTLAGLGVHRVLTSGGADRAPQALPALAQMVEHANGRIDVMAGGGIALDDVSAILATGVDAVHASAKRVVGDDGGIVLGSAGPSLRETTDEVVAHSLRGLVPRG